MSLTKRIYKAEDTKANKETDIQSKEITNLKIEMQKPKSTVVVKSVDQVQKENIFHITPDGIYIKINGEIKKLQFEP